MASMNSDDYITNASWLSANVCGDDKILYGASALEFLGMFTGYLKEKTIEIYSTKPIVQEGIICRQVDSFEGIDYERHGNLLCSTFEQAVNDLLDDENLDELALCEGLSDYYFSHGESFEGLNIKAQNREKFDFYKDGAIAYYDS
ncbi:MAG: hypothetical protein LUI06_04700 [Ruminococcus sp.]|nr:hypothetical protein [Ruminococcus sp.]